MAESLHGTNVRLDPLERSHVAALVAAAAEDPTLYDWSIVPQGEERVRAYVESALDWRERGLAHPFAIVRLDDDTVAGTTRIFDLERWGSMIVGEIGYTWLARSATRTAINTESKLLLLTYAFERLEMARVCFHTDERNARSRAAIERVGGTFEGILRAHRPAIDGGARNSARYSITVAEWPEVKKHLEARPRTR